MRNPALDRHVSVVVGAFASHSACMNQFSCGVIQKTLQTVFTVSLTDAQREIDSEENKPASSIAVFLWGT